MMAVHRVLPGDLFAVPLSATQVAVGIVLHVSRYFRGSIMVGFYGQVFPSIDHIDLISIDGAFLDTPNYTGKKALTTGRWSVIGHSSELLGRTTIPKLRVAYTLLYKDEPIRKLSPSEISAYPEVAGQGALLVENWLRRKFGIGNAAGV